MARSAGFVGRGVALPDVEDDADVAWLAGGAKGFDASAMRDQRVMQRLAGGLFVGAAGREDAHAVADPDRDGLVERGPAAHPVAEGSERQIGVVGEGVDDAAVDPAALVLEGLRQVPVIERDVGRDAGVEQFVDEARVEVDALLVDRASPFGDQARPAQREAIAGDADVLHQRHVFAIAMVVVGAAIAGDVARDLAGRVAEGVPDRGALAVLVPRALDLEGTGGDAEIEAGRELNSRHNESPDDGEARLVTGGNSGAAPRGARHPAGRLTSQ